MDERSSDPAWFSGGVIRAIHRGPVFSTRCFDPAEEAASRLLTCRALGARPTPAEMVQHDLQDDFAVSVLGRPRMVVSQTPRVGFATRQQVLAARGQSR